MHHVKSFSTLIVAEVWLLLMMKALKSELRFIAKMILNFLIFMKLLKMVNCFWNNWVLLLSYYHTRGAVLPLPSSITFHICFKSVKYNSHTSLSHLNFILSKSAITVWLVSIFFQHFEKCILWWILPWF